MRTKRGGRAVLVMAAVLALAAPATAASPDVQAAKDALVRLTDFPSGWERTDTASTPDAYRCRGFKRQRAAATGVALPDGAFQRGELTAVVPGTFVFGTEGRARRALRALTSFGVRRCEGRRAAKEVARAPGVRLLAPTRTSRIDAPDVGDRSVAERFRTRINYRGRDTTVIIDLVVFRAGPGVSQLAFLRIGKRFKPSLRDKLVRTAEQRLKFALVL